MTFQSKPSSGHCFMARLLWGKGKVGIWSASFPLAASSSHQPLLRPPAPCAPFDSTCKLHSEAGPLPGRM